MVTVHTKLAARMGQMVISAVDPAQLSRASSIARIAWLFVLLCAAEHAFTAFQGILLGRELSETMDALDPGKGAADFGGPGAVLLLSLGCAWLASVWLLRKLGCPAWLVPFSAAERARLAALWEERRDAPGTLQLFYPLYSSSIAMVALCFSERFFKALSYGAVHALLFVQCATGLLLAATAAVAVQWAAQAGKEVSRAARAIARAGRRAGLK